MSGLAHAPARAGSTVVPVDFGHASAEAFKDGMRRLAQPVAIATVARAKERAGLTISSFCSLSVDPPRVMACISHSAGAFPLIARGAAMAINVLAQGQAGMGQRFASSSIKGETRFDVGHWDTGVCGAPVLRDALTVFDGRVRDVVDAGTHSIVTVDVVAVCGAATDGPLLYAAGGFTGLAPGAQGDE
ncbi:flavin reductase [Azoarcus sp. L1K30]|uniref:flavin reductase family protein n=1 Tax=Azoarcus sp. L1K30 TaxID=2820277 RepID=UPI001B8200F9|nr:flavin reductase family protein [Azoarcus sp. L1K30]MBR0565343.1 flavin reductase [Azoarcus sp. L1K30]